MADRFVMTEKLFSLAGRYVVRDEAGQERYQVVGKMLSVGDKLSFQDAAGTELATIKQKMLSLAPAYQIVRDGKVVAVVKQHLINLLSLRFTVDVPGPDDLEAAGDLLGREYVFRRHEQVVATVSRRWFSLSDTYGVEVSDGEDEVLVLASAVVIDRLLHEHV
jgi:uncharacterized protein YxjI